MSEQETLTSPEFKQRLASLYSYLVKHLGIKQSPPVKLINSRPNAENPFGFTGHYDHTNNLITLYITDRHDTDILRSFAHELIHHWQNERGTLHPHTNNVDDNSSIKPHYAQENGWMRRREMEAYLFGNILFRDWQDEQRHGVPQVQPEMPQPLDENLLLQTDHLKDDVKHFVNKLIASGKLNSYHREKTSGDMQANDFSEDLTHEILSAIERWIQTVNNRGDWENQPDMIK